MKGATSSSVYLITCHRAHETQRFVLRVLDNQPWLANEPDLVEHEAATLREARAAGLPAPELVASALEDVGFGAPALLMTHLEGQVVLRPKDSTIWLRDLAATLARTHRHAAKGFPWQ